MAQQLSSYTDLRRVFRRTARAATHVISTTWFSRESEHQPVDAELIELRCLQHKGQTELESACYENAHESTPSVL